MSCNVEQNLTEKEIGIVQDLLGPSREKIFAGIAEVWLGQNSDVEDWGEKPLVSPGVVCFIKDLDKDNFQLWIINMSKGIVAWKQNVDKHITTQRRRRWIFVLDVGYRKLCLNFVDDDEADEFAYVLYGKFPEFQCFKGTMPYTVKENGMVFRNPNKADPKSKQEKIKNFVTNVAGLPESVLDDPNYSSKINAFMEEYGDEIEDYGDIFDNYELEVEEDEYGSEGIIEDEEEDRPSISNQVSSEVASPALDFMSHFDMGEYGAVDMEELALEPASEEPVFPRSSPKPPETPSQKSKPNKPPPPPPLNIAKPTKSNINRGENEDQRGSLLDQIRNSSMALKKSPKSQKRITKNGADSIEHVLFGAMQQIRTMKNTDYGALPEEMYRDWQDSD